MQPPLPSDIGVVVHSAVPPSGEPAESAAAATMWIMNSYNDSGHEELSWQAMEGRLLSYELLLRELLDNHTEMIRMTHSKFMAPLNRPIRHRADDAVPTALRAVSQPNIQLPSAMQLPPTLPPRAATKSWRGCDEDTDPRCFKHRVFNEQRRVPSSYKDESYLHKMKFLRSHLNDTLFEHSPSILTPASSSPLETTPRTPHKVGADDDVPRAKRPRPISAPVDRTAYHHRDGDDEAPANHNEEQRCSKTSRRDSMPWARTNERSASEAVEDAVPFPMSDDAQTARQWLSARDGECCPSCLLEAQAKSLNLVDFSWISVQILLQSTSAALSRRWELRRMADQVLPVLLQLLCWFDLDSLTGTALRFLSESDCAFFHFAALLSIKYLLRVIHELIVEGQTVSLHSKSMVNEVDAVLPLLAQRILAIDSGSNQMQLLIAEILILIHSKKGSVLQMDEGAHSEHIDHILSELERLRKHRADSRSVDESQTWILSSVHHFLPSLIRSCTVAQQRRFIPLLVGYVEGPFEDQIKVSSLQCIELVFSAANRNDERFVVESADSVVDSVVKLICAQNNDPKLKQMALGIVLKMDSLSTDNTLSLKQWVNGLKAKYEDRGAESEGDSWDSWDDSSQNAEVEALGDSLQKCILHLSRNAILDPNI